MLLSLFAGRVFAQTAPGMVDNYSGSASVWLNPSNISTTFVHNDFGLASLSFSLDNNFAYLPAGDFWPDLRGLLAENGTWATYNGLQEDHPYYYRYFAGDKNRNAFEASFDFTFPSMMMSFANNHAIAFTMRSRFCTSATRMPWEIPVLITESLEYPPMQQMRYVSEGMRFSTMAWEEVDLSYSTKVIDYGAVKLDAGLTGKLLLGMAGTTLRTDSLDYVVLNSDQLYFYGLDGMIDMAIPLGYDVPFRDVDNFLKITDPLVKGFGLGVDVGFTVTGKRSSMVVPSERTACDDRPEPYYWRLGVSLLDLGAVRFGRNVLSGNLTGQNFLVNLDDFDTVTMITGAAALLDELVGNDASAFDDASPFSIGLPTALSVQYDLNVYDDFYCNLTWIQPVSRWLYPNAVEREPLLSLTPRYERSLVGVALPVSLYNYSYVTAGAFLRVGPFSLGTNDLISLAGWGKTRSIDFFVSVRLKLDRGDCLFGRVYDACGDKIRRLVR